MSYEVLQRILSRMKELDMSPRAASLASGLSATAIRDFVRKPDTSPSLLTLKKYAEGLKTTPQWLAFGDGDADALEPEISGDVTPVASKFVRAIYGGIVEAGSFRRVEEFDDEAHTRDPIYEAVDTEFPDAALVTFDVAGDSMNALKPRPLFPGDRVVCLDFESLKNRAPVRDGMVVVVEHTINGGQMRERSVKQMEIYRDRTEYCPRSTNPRHKPIVVPRDVDPDDGREVTILAIVRRITTDVVI